MLMRIRYFTICAGREGGRGERERERGGIEYVMHRKKYDVFVVSLSAISSVTALASLGQKPDKYVLVFNVAPNASRQGGNMSVMSV